MGPGGGPACDICVTVAATRLPGPSSRLDPRRSKRRRRSVHDGVELLLDRSRLIGSGLSRDVVEILRDDRVLLSDRSCRRIYRADVRGYGSIDRGRNVCVGGYRTCDRRSDVRVNRSIHVDVQQVAVERASDINGTVIDDVGSAIGNVGNDIGGIAIERAAIDNTCVKSAGIGGSIHRR